MGRGSGRVEHAHAVDDAADGISRLRSQGVLDEVADRAQPTLHAMLD